MKIGLDLDGTVLDAKYTDFFRSMVHRMHDDHECQFFCISSHGRHEWEELDVPRLKALGFNTDLINPSLMNPTRHGELVIKGKACDQCDIVFDDDQRLKDYTKTPVLSPLG